MNKQCGQPWQPGTSGVTCVLLRLSGQAADMLRDSETSKKELKAKYMAVGEKVRCPLLGSATLFGHT